MLGYSYYNMSMWNNAIACFEKVEQGYYFYMSDIHWMPKKTCHVQPIIMFMF